MPWRIARPPPSAGETRVPTARQVSDSPSCAAVESRTRRLTSGRYSRGVSVINAAAASTGPIAVAVVYGLGLATAAVIGGLFARRNTNRSVAAERGQPDRAELRAIVDTLGDEFFALEQVLTQASGLLTNALLDPPSSRAANRELLLQLRDRVRLHSEMAAQQVERLRRRVGGRRGSQLIRAARDVTTPCRRAYLAIGDVVLQREPEELAQRRGRDFEAAYAEVNHRRERFISTGLKFTRAKLD